MSTEVIYAPESNVSMQQRPALLRPRVLLADDNQYILERVASLLKADFDLVGIVNDGRTLVSEAQRLQPDLVVTDITMPVLNGIEAAHEIRTTASEIKIVFLTVHVEREYVSACIAEGGLGYVTKSRLRTDLIPALREALLDRPFISPSLGY